MKTQEEIQEAHDFLHAVLALHDELAQTGGALSPEVEIAIHSAHDALCFVLGCPNPAFANNLAILRKHTEQHGLKLAYYTSHPE